MPRFENRTFLLRRVVVTKKFFLQLYKSDVFAAQRQ